MAGAAVFTGASLICALAPAIPALIAGRALAGLGAALLLPPSLAIVHTSLGRTRPSARRVDRLQWSRPGDRANSQRRVDRRLRPAQRLSDCDPP
jgi:hypothetical protein